jgi:hypothetical protein
VNFYDSIHQLPKFEKVFDVQKRHKSEFRFPLRTLREGFDCILKRSQRNEVRWNTIINGKLRYFEICKTREYERCFCAYKSLPNTQIGIKRSTTNNSLVWTGRFPTCSLLICAYYSRCSGQNQNLRRIHCTHYRDPQRSR